MVRDARGKWHGWILVLQCSDGLVGTIVGR